MTPTYYGRYVPIHSGIIVKTRDSSEVHVAL